MRALVLALLNEGLDALEVQLPLRDVSGWEAVLAQERRQSDIGDEVTDVNCPFNHSCGGRLATVREHSYPDAENR